MLLDRIGIFAHWANWTGRLRTDRGLGSVPGGLRFCLPGNQQNQGGGTFQTEQMGGRK
jgi:hypothetical protein